MASHVLVDQAFMSWDPARGERRHVERKSRERIEAWLRDYAKAARGLQQDVDHSVNRTSAEHRQSAPGEKYRQSAPDEKRSER
jgi:hypothetical protein